MSDVDPATADRVRDLLLQMRPERTRDELTDDLPLIKERIIDSLGLLHLVSAVEEEFGVRVGEEEIVPSNFGTIAGIAALVGRKRGPLT